MLEGLEIPAMTYGICANADLYARDIEITENGVSFNMQLAGMHNIPVNPVSYTHLVCPAVSQMDLSR